MYSFHSPTHSLHCQCLWSVASNNTKHPIHEHSNHFTVISDLKAAAPGLEPSRFLLVSEALRLARQGCCLTSGERCPFSNTHSGLLHYFKPGILLHRGLCQMQMVRMLLPRFWELWTKCDSPSYMLRSWKKEWVRVSLVQVLKHTRFV